MNRALAAGGLVGLLLGTVGYAAGVEWWVTLALSAPLGALAGWLVSDRRRTHR